ncbi:MAG: hypothetical protein ABIU54_10895 [Candidatus Eisenbacteria bacterium]
MTGLIRKATLIVACGVLGATSAMAGVPSSGNSTVPGRINLSGILVTPGRPDTMSSLTKIQITVRDLANNPINGSSVAIDFDNCNKSKVCDTQTYQGMTTSAGPNVRAFTNAAGVATLVVTGGNTASTSATADPNGCARVYADGVLLGTINIGAYDLNAGGGVNGTDLSLFAADLFAVPANASRSDYNNSGGVDGLDLSLFAAALFNPNGISSCATAYWP